MIVEVTGIGFPNKGAELMLASILEEFRRRAVPAVFAMDVRTSHRNRLRWGLRHVLPASASERHGWLRRIPSGIRKPLGLVLPEDVDVLLDASGYAYGDSWGATKARDRLGARLEEWKRQGRKVILLPQALGPFQEPALRKEMARIFQHADLVFARDPISLEHAAELAGAEGKILLAPDFTCLLHPDPSPEALRRKGMVCLIPNHKMLEKTGLDESVYVGFFRGVAKHVQESGRVPYLLLHEGERDLALCRRIAAGTGLEMESPADPVRIKGLIGSASMVVTSRFHGFVSALSQGVPAFATSWSHKYEMLAKDYTDENLILDSADLPDALARIARILEEGRLSSLESSLSAAASEQKLRTTRMWDTVFGCIMSK